MDFLKVGPFSMRVAIAPVRLESFLLHAIFPTT